MAGIVQDQGYHDREVASSLDGNRVIHHGPVGGSARSQMLGSARALLHLINFEEPFGLSVVEAMACGTPVIAFRSEEHTSELQSLMRILYAVFCLEKKKNNKQNKKNEYINV